MQIYNDTIMTVMKKPTPKNKWVAMLPGPWKIILPLTALVFAVELYWMARVAVKVAIWLFC